MWISWTWLLLLSSMGVFRKKKLRDGICKIIPTLTPGQAMGCSGAFGYSLRTFVCSIGNSLGLLLAVFLFSILGASLGLLFCAAIFGIVALLPDLLVLSYPGEP